MFRSRFPSLLFIALAGMSDAYAVEVRVDPHTTLGIEGITELDRKRYFSISDHGQGFDRRVGSKERYDYLTRDLDISFGRLLGPVRNRIPPDLREDPRRPGFADLDQVRRFSAQHAKSDSPELVADFGANLDVAAHGNHNAFPAFMGRWQSQWIKDNPEPDGHPPDFLPENIEAAAELSSTVFRHAFTDFARPRYYEPVNEPHWSYLTEPAHISAWHLATMKKMHLENPGVLVGGPCNSVGHFYSDGYSSFRGIRNFIDATGAKLDFYSFHAYDYYRWNGKAFVGSILSGLPLEGVLDLVPNHIFNRHGRTVPLVVSEHGGYASTDKAEDKSRLIEEIASTRFPGSGFEWKMKTRAIHDFIQVNSTISNTLAFMDHPHSVLKCVPFVLLESAGWDPQYYATLYSRKDFDPRSREWSPSTLGYFYDLFNGLKGRRVMHSSNDPDIQIRTFVDGNKLHIVANNLSDQAEILSITAPEPESIHLKRYGKSDDLTPYLRKESARSLGSISLSGLETVVIVAAYRDSIREERIVNESIHYGESTVVPARYSALITVPVSSPETVESAILRIGFNRPADAGKEISVRLNGHEVQAPVEDSADRFTHKSHGYSSTRFISIDASLLETANTVEISFPDGGDGTIGSAVIRAIRPK